jgi:hypothetical protein
MSAVDTDEIPPRTGRLVRIPAEPTASTDPVADSR